jgi:hypothetical protein
LSQAPSFTCRDTVITETRIASRTSSTGACSFIETDIVDIYYSVLDSALLNLPLVQLVHWKDGRDDRNACIITLCLLKHDGERDSDSEECVCKFRHSSET